MDFVRSYFGTNEPLTSKTLLFFFSQISTDLDKKGGKKWSAGQRFIFIKVIIQGDTN